MHFINYIKVPFPEAVGTFGLSDNFLYSVSFTGFYQPVPQSNDNFDIYNTGGGQFTQLFFSGSGNWSNSGYSNSYNRYLFDSFDNYLTGAFFISGLQLNSGVSVSGYSVSNNASAQLTNSYIYLYLNLGQYNTGIFVSGTNLVQSTNYAQTVLTGLSPSFGSGSVPYFSFPNNSNAILFDDFDFKGFKAEIRITGFSGAVPYSREMLTQLESSFSDDAGDLYISGINSNTGIWHSYRGSGMIYPNQWTLVTGITGSTMLGPGFEKSLKIGGTLTSFDMRNIELIQAGDPGDPINIYWSGQQEIPFSRYDDSVFARSGIFKWSFAPGVTIPIRKI